MSSTNVLADRDVNAAATNKVMDGEKAEVKSMEYHRQVLQSKLEESQYVTFHKCDVNVRIGGRVG